MAPPRFLLGSLEVLQAIPVRVLELSVMAAGWKLAAGFAVFALVSQELVVIVIVVVVVVVMVVVTMTTVVHENQARRSD